MKVIFGNNKKILSGRSTSEGGPPGHEGGRAPPTSWAPWMPSDAKSNSIYLLSERKNQREEIIAFYDMEPPPSPKTSREG